MVVSSVQADVCMAALQTRQSAHLVTPAGLAQRNRGPHDDAWTYTQEMQDCSGDAADVSCMSCAHGILTFPYYCVKRVRLRSLC